MNTIKILVIDVDGTLTDGKIYIGDQGEMFKAFNVKDGYAIVNLLPKYKIEPIVITGRKSIIVEKRCKELGIVKVIQECKDKRSKLIEIAKEYEMTIVDGKILGVAYMGDDIPDIPGMEISELVGCPADAAYEVKNISNYVCKATGGCGALREFVEWLIKREI